MALSGAVDEATDRTADGAAGGAPLLRVEGLRVRFPGDPDTGAPDRLAVDGASFEVGRGEIVCVVGESGAGKSTVGTAVLGLLDGAARLEAGRIVFDGVDLAGLDDARLRPLRGRRIGAVFQDPLSALNPVLSIGRQMIPAIRHATGASARGARSRAIELLARVQIPEPERCLSRYPHELSGGMRQRVVVAIAIAGDPDLLIADEPTTALDVSIQNELLHVFGDLAAEHGIGVLLVTHDMAVVAEVADRVVVMRDGRVVEQGDAQAVLFAPEHAYTRELIAAVPRSDARMVRFDVAREEALGTTARSSDGRASAEPALLSLRNLLVTFEAPRTLRAARPEPIRALDDVDLDVGPGEALGVVGESGSGKSTLAKVACGLLAPDAGTVHYDGVDVTNAASDRRLRRSMLSMQMIFQDPFASLDPRQRVLDALVEPQSVLGRGTRGERRGARARRARIGRARRRRGHASPARVLGRPATAHLDRPGAGPRAEAPDLRRADVGARRVGAGDGAGSPRRAPAPARPDPPFHQSRSRRRAPAVRPHRGHAPRPRRRARTRRGAVRAPPRTTTRGA